MSVPLTLLGLLERGPSHGYDLKRDYDAYFGRDRVAYLACLGVQALRSARRGEYGPLDGNDREGTAQNAAGWRQGFVSNITNPKVLVFYLAVLPQFLTPGAGLSWLLLLAWSHAVLSLAYLLVLVTGLHGARRLLMRRRVRRALDATTGAVLLGFGARLATEHV